MIETKSIIEKVNAQFNKMWNEILEKGWKYILETYHPDTNIDYQEAQEIFNLYRKIHFATQKRFGIAQPQLILLTPKEQILLLNLYKINI